MSATLKHALDKVARLVPSGDFAARLSGWIACDTDSRAADCGPRLRVYLAEVMAPELAALGFQTTILENPKDPDLHFLSGERLEDPAQETVLIYAHGDTVAGMASEWQPGLDPHELTVRDGRLYGRGTADNKGQLAINLAALRAVIETRGSLGFNCRILVEMGEERGSPGLAELARTRPGCFSADVLVASDGPRLSLDQPTLCLGARGSMRFDMDVSLRDAARHSGHWGGLLRDPAVILAQAIAAICDGNGRLRVPEMRTGSLTPGIRKALAEIDASTLEDVAEPGWGEPGLTVAERVFGWNSLCVLALNCGQPAKPVAAINGAATAHCQLRYVVGTDPDQVVPAIREHLSHLELDCVTVRELPGFRSPATRLDPENPWVKRCALSVEKTLGKRPAILPNIGGSIPNHVFAEIAGLPTIWVPHSYPGCGQHGPDEHLDAGIVSEGLTIMTGLFWDLGERLSFMH